MQGSSQNTGLVRMKVYDEQLPSKLHHSGVGLEWIITTRADNAAEYRKINPC